MAVKGAYSTAALQEGLGADPTYDAASGLAVWEQVVDFSKVDNNMAVNDTMPLFKIPAGILIMGALVQTITAEGAAATVDMGITGGDVDGYIDGATVNAAGNVISGDAATAEPIAMENSGRMTAAEELVSILALGAIIDDALVRFKVFGADLRALQADTSSL